MHTLNLNLNTFSLQLEEMLRNYSSLLFTSPFFQGTISNWAGDLKAISWTDVGYSFIISTSIKQVKVGVGVDFKCSICIWKLLLWTHIMQSKELSMQVNQIIKEHSVWPNQQMRKKNRGLTTRCKQGQINLYQNDRKKKVWKRLGTSHDPKHTTSSVKHGGAVWWHEHAQLPTTLGYWCLAMTEATRIILKYVGIYGLPRFSQMQQSRLDASL